MTKENILIPAHAFINLIEKSSSKLATTNSALATALDNKSVIARTAYEVFIKGLISVKKELEIAIVEITRLYDALIEKKFKMAGETVYEIKKQLELLIQNCVTLQDTFTRPINSIDEKTLILISESKICLDHIVSYGIDFILQHVIPLTEQED